MSENYNYRIVDNIINLLSILRDEETRDPYTIDHGGAKYLLGQSLRQLWLPASQRYLSLEADKLYNQLSIPEDQVFTLYYQMKVTNNSDNQVYVDLYKGASKTAHTHKLLNKGDSFVQREVFHDDHIIPIKHIIEKLQQIKILNRENVMDVIKDISICRMLKCEDRDITRTKRQYNEEHIIENLYLEKNIRIKDYVYKKIV